MDLSIRNVSKPLLFVGLGLGLLGDSLLRAPEGPSGLNMFVCVAAVALAAYLLQRHAGLALDRERIAWLAIPPLFAAGFAWRDAEPLKVLALGCITVGF